MSDLDQKIGRKFKCTKCANRKSEVRRVAATGAGISRFLDWQHTEFISVSCSRCGYTEIYDPKVFRDSSKVMSILDLIFTD